MEDLITLTSGIEFKLRSLLNDYKKLKEAEMEQRIKLAEQTDIINQQKNKIKELENRISVLKISGSITDKKDAAKMRQMIDKLVRELDQCIQLY